MGACIPAVRIRPERWSGVDRQLRGAVAHLEPEATRAGANWVGESIDRSYMDAARLRTRIVIDI